MVLELNEYVRTKSGIISKVIGVQSGGIEKYYFDKKIIDNFKELTQIGTENVVLKHSFNIIDLIEEDDYVNGKEVSQVLKDKKGNITDVCYYEEAEEQMYSLGDIKSIVTKEQFKAMEYEVK